MNKKVVYTCITGNYDDLINHSFINPDWDYVCFTDNLNIKNTENSKWNIRLIKFSEMDDIRNQRWHKLHPHILFPDYEESLWVDANIDIINSGVFEDVDKIKEKGWTIATPKHPERNCIYDELEACIRYNKDNENLMKKQIELIKKDNFPKNYGLFETNIVYRKHKDKKLIKIMNSWWYWVKNYSRRDQLSFTYVLWKNSFMVEPLNDKPYNGSNLNRIKFFENKNHITKDELRGEIATLNDKIFNLIEDVKNRDFELDKLKEALQEKNIFINKIQKEIILNEEEIKNKEIQIEAFKNSTSWKVTKPARLIIKKIKKIIKL